MNWKKKPLILWRNIPLSKCTIWSCNLNNHADKQIAAVNQLLEWHVHYFHHYTWRNHNSHDLATLLQNNSSMQNNASTKYTIVHCTTVCVILVWPRLFTHRTSAKTRIQNFFVIHWHNGRSNKISCCCFTSLSLI